MFEVLEHDDFGWTAWTTPFKSESMAWQAIEDAINESLRQYYSHEIDEFKKSYNFKVDPKG